MSAACAGAYTRRMRMLKIEDSSNVEAVGFDGNSIMRVRFKNGGLYEYQHVQSIAFAAILCAESVGKELKSRVINAPDRHPFKRIEAEQHDIGQKLNLTLKFEGVVVLGSARGHGLCYKIHLPQKDYAADTRVVWIDDSEIVEREEIP